MDDRAAMERAARAGDGDRGTSGIAAGTSAQTDPATRARDDFLATMSHEFRTPLNAVIGYAQLLSMGILGPLTPLQHDHLERLEASASHLLRLVNDVLDIAQADADRLHVAREIHSAHAVIRAALLLVQPQAAKKGVHLREVQGNDVPYMGDEHRVRQILVNVLWNAIKFTPAGGTVTLATGRTTRAGFAGDVAYMSVTDTGRGVPEAMRERIFEPFVQADGNPPGARSGTGLGLAISRRLARLMGGELTLEPHRGAGAHFVLWLPSAAADDVANAVEALALTAPADVSPAGVVQDVLDEHGFEMLRRIGVRITTNVEQITERYVAGLRSDPHFPDAAHRTESELRDHVTPVISLIAAQLMLLGETRGNAPDMLRDGGRVQRLLAELHGRQRRTLGWQAADIEREGELLSRMVVEVVEANRQDDRISDAALQQAVALVRQVFQQATRASVREFRRDGDDA